MRPHPGASLAIVLLALFALVAPAGAGHGPSFVVLTVDPESLKRLVDDRTPFLAVDLRSRPEYDTSRLPRARSLPLPELHERFAEIPPTGMVVLYCACSPTEINGAYQFLRARGYHRLFILEEGFAGWRARGYPLEP
ncbi:MAG: rhodanese-like domain-containing protein [Candidatus Rokuibacteriota bacterium]